MNSLIRDVQEAIYCNLNLYSKNHEISGRMLSIPVAILDVTLDTLCSPVQSIQLLANTVMNLLGAAFSNNYTLKKALLFGEYSLNSAAITPVKLATAPFKLVFQVFAGIICPEKVNSIAFLDAFKK